MQASSTTSSPAEEPREGYEVTWGGKQVILGIVLVILGNLVVGLLISPVVHDYGEESVQAQRAIFAAGISWRLVSFLSIYVMAGGSDLAFSRLGFRLPPGMNWGKVAAYAVGGFIAAQAIFVIYGEVASAIGYDRLIPKGQIEPVVFDNTVLIALLGITVVGMAPIYEELLVRGFLFGWVRKVVGPFPAILTTSLLFGLVHGQWALIIPVTLIAMLLSYAYHRTNTIYVPMGIHLIVNTVSFFAMVFIPEARD